LIAMNIARLALLSILFVIATAVLYSQGNDPVSPHDGANNATGETKRDAPDAGPSIKKEEPANTDTRATEPHDSVIEDKDSRPKDVPPGKNDAAPDKPTDETVREKPPVDTLEKPEEKPAEEPKKEPEEKKEHPVEKTEPKAHEKPEPAKDEAPGITQKMFAGFTLGYGYSYPGGKISGVGDQKLETTYGYAVGGEFGYMVLDWGAAVIALDYASKPAAVSRSFMGMPQESNYTFTFLDISALFRGWYSFADIRLFRLYGEIGMFYGLKFGKWTLSDKIGGTVHEHDLSSVSPGTVQNEWGPCLGFGVVYVHSPRVNVNAGIRIKASMQNAFEGEDEIKSNTILFVLGALYRF